MRKHFLTVWTALLIAVVLAFSPVYAAQPAGTDAAAAADIAGAAENGDGGKASEEAGQSADSGTDAGAEIGETSDPAAVQDGEKTGQDGEEIPAETAGEAGGIGTESGTGKDGQDAADPETGGETVPAQETEKTGGTTAVSAEEEAEPFILDATSRSNRKRIFIGDSRTVEYYYSVFEPSSYSSNILKTDTYGDVWSAKVGEGLSWMKKTGVPQIESRIDSNTDVVILMGVNDVVDGSSAYNQYISYINQKGNEWAAKGAHTFYVSITPVGSGPGDDDYVEHWGGNTYVYSNKGNISEWNSAMEFRLNTNVHYLNLYSAVIRDYSSPDELHYSSATCRKIYQLLIDMTSEVDNSLNSVREEDARSFVAAMYYQIFDRPADSSGLATWSKKLMNGTTGSQLVSVLSSSTEFKAKYERLTNVEYIRAMYLALLGRQADASGLSDWLSKLNNGCTRALILQGLCGSIEFDIFCTHYSIRTGTCPSPNIEDKNPQVTAFVARLYRYCLEREFDRSGLQYWCTGMLQKGYTGGRTAWGFFFSKEMNNRHLSNADFTTVAYMTLLNRNPDDAGLAYWVARLDGGMSREDLFNGFRFSTEFSNLCKSYGINA